MADSTVYGPEANPVPEGPLQRIFEFHGPGGSNYAIAKFRIWRRMYSQNALNYNLWRDGGSMGGSPSLVDPDPIVESKLLYSSFFAWPVNNLTMQPATPPFDTPPSQVTGDLGGGLLTGQPTLPSDFGVGVPTKGSPGKYQTDGNMSAGFEPNLRASAPAGGTPATGGVVPDPPAANGRTGSWGSTSIKFDLIDGGGISITDPGPDGGAALASVDVSFGGLTYVDGSDRTFRAIAGAVRPQDWSSYTRQPLWSSNITGLKGSPNAEIWILMQRQR